MVRLIIVFRVHEISGAQHVVLPFDSFFVSVHSEVLLNMSGKGKQTTASGHAAFLFVDSLVTT
jgi:hypothetical protein